MKSRNKITSGRPVREICKPGNNGCLEAARSQEYPWDSHVSGSFEPTQLTDPWTGERLPRTWEVLWWFLCEETAQLRKSGRVVLDKMYSVSPYIFGAHHLELFQLAFALKKDRNKLYYLVALGSAHLRGEVLQLRKEIEAVGADEFKSCHNFLSDRGLPSDLHVVMNCDSQIELRVDFESR